MVNTEKPTTKAEQKKNIIKAPLKQGTQDVLKKVVQEKKIPESKKETEDKTEKEKTPETSKQPEAKPEEKKKPIQKKPKVKKTEAVVNGSNLHISTKYSMAICKFIKGKKIQDAIDYLELVIVKRKSIPMKGEIPHRKGPGKIGSGSGRFPKKASENFIVLLKSLQGNVNANELEEPIIVEAIANIGSRPYGKFGSVRRKRTHVMIKVKEKKLNKKK